MQGRVIKHCARNKQRWLGLKGISHSTNITNLSAVSETYAEVSIRRKHLRLTTKLPPGKSLCIGAP
jgi:hypothetical protein